MNSLERLTNEERLNPYFLALNKRGDDGFLEMLRKELDHRVWKNLQTV